MLIGVIIGVRELIEKYQREKTVDGTTAAKVSPLDQPALVPEVKPGEPATAAPAPAPATPAAAPEAAPAAATPLPGTVAPATDTVPPTSAVVKPVQNEIINPPAPIEVKPLPPPAPEVKPESAEPAVNADPASKSGHNEIILEALDKVEVKFQIKGETKKLSLAPTQVHTIHADQPIILDVSDGGAINIILNGRERGVPGDLGKPKQIKIP
jgi:cytoskeleton protein RodZ